MNEAPRKFQNIGAVYGEGIRRTGEKVEARKKEKQVWVLIYDRTERNGDQKKQDAEGRCIKTCT